VCLQDITLKYFTVWSFTKPSKLSEFVSLSSQFIASFNLFHTNPIRLMLLQLDGSKTNLQPFLKIRYDFDNSVKMMNFKLGNEM